MLANYHMHTSYSEDSVFQMENVVKCAISRGLNEICFTDHIDVLPDVEPYFPYNAYKKDFLHLKEKYSDKINLKLGMEFGMQFSTIPIFERIFEKLDFDFILMSCHQIDNKWFWNQEFQSGKTQCEYNLQYYEEILKLVKNYNNYSVLGHLDLMRRYDRHGMCPFDIIEPVVREILTEVIKNGKGIELNVSSFRYNLGDLMPSTNILKLYKELGGQIITIGTDSHREEHVECDLIRGREELQKLGYKEFCTFTNMQPEFHELIN